MLLVFRNQSVPGRLLVRAGRIWLEIAEIQRGHQPDNIRGENR
jgi:hypothetical protein